MFSRNQPHQIFQTLDQFREFLLEVLNDLAFGVFSHASSRAPISLFDHSSKAAAGETKSVVHVPFRTHMRTARRHSSSSRDPHSSSTVVDLVSTDAQSSVTVRDSACDPDLFTAIPIGIGINLGDVCLAGTGGEKQRRGNQDSESGELLYLLGEGAE